MKLPEKIRTKIIDPFSKIAKRDESFPEIQGMAADASYGVEVQMMKQNMLIDVLVKALKQAERDLFAVPGDKKQPSLLMIIGALRKAREAGHD